MQSVFICLRCHQITFHIKWFLWYLRDIWHYCQGLWFVWSLFFFVNLFLKTCSPLKNIVLLPEYKSFQPKLFWFSFWLEGICEYSPEMNTLDSMENHYILLLWFGGWKDDSGLKCLLCKQGWPKFECLEPKCKAGHGCNWCQCWWVRTSLGKEVSPRSLSDLGSDRNVEKELCKTSRWQDLASACSHTSKFMPRTYTQPLIQSMVFRGRWT